jgi:uncharacterized protein DUF6306/uncharacterized protein DUF6522
MGRRRDNGIIASADGFTVKAELIAQKLGLTPEAFWRELQRGIVYSVVERGEGDDSGRTRLTFRYRARFWSVTLRDGDLGGDAAMIDRAEGEPTAEVSSPACSMREASDVYMGYAGRDELIAVLNELLEAEHAGARVTLESARAAGSGPVAELLRRIQRDEAHWCAMLAGHLRAAGVTPSATVGAFYGKAMAIADLAERIAFLNRGQGWVARKLREMLPRVRPDRLHADLFEMLRSHEANIALANELVGRPS